METFEYNKESRNRIIRDILCDIKSHLIRYYHNSVDVDFRENAINRNGFEYSMSIYKSDSQTYDYDEFFKAKTYAKESLTYLLNPNTIELTICEDLHSVEIIIYSKF